MRPADEPADVVQAEGKGRIQMTIISVSRAATPDEIAAEMDRRGAVIDNLETNLRHWREECGKLHSQLETAEEKLRLSNTGSLSLLYDIRRELGWNDKTSLSILADGVRRVRRALQTWDTPTGMDLEALALAIKARVVDLEKANVDNKNRIEELLEELAGSTEELDDHL
jgi:hypothetical protein